MNKKSPIKKRGTPRPKPNPHRSESGELLVAETVRQASQTWNIPLQVLKIAKAHDCPAFVGHRIHRGKLVRWISENEGLIAEAVESEASESDIGQLRAEKLRVEVRILNAKFEREQETVISKTSAKGEWARAVGIFCDEAKALMEPEHFRVFCERTRSRIGDLHEQNNSLTNANHMQ